jgi:hypothetical protein
MASWAGDFRFHLVLWVAFLTFLLFEMNKGHSGFTEIESDVRLEKRYGGEVGAIRGAPRPAWNYFSIFSYSVDGVTYNAERSGWGFAGLGPQKIVIYYNPNNPKEFVLDKTPPASVRIFHTTLVVFVGAIGSFFILKRRQKVKWNRA